MFKDTELIKLQEPAQALKIHIEKLEELALTMERSFDSLGFATSIGNHPSGSTNVKGDKGNIKLWWNSFNPTQIVVTLNKTNGISIESGVSLDTMDEALPHLLKELNRYEDMPQETIVSAAILIDTGENTIIASAPRDAHHKHVIDTLRDLGVKEKHNQGFLTSDGRFVDRIEGGKIAIASGQIHQIARPPYLYTHDLW